VTLIAAYRDRGVPVLLGDFLIIGSGQAAGLRKKVHRLQPNLVVGWTGHKLAAELVLTGLHHRFQAERPTKAGLEQFLTSFPTGNLGSLSVTLVGWICDHGQYCFRWRSDWPQSVFYGDYHFAGSGEAMFRHIFGTGSGIDAPDPDDPAERILFAACRLLIDEVSGRFFQSMGFGHAYEALYLDQGEFQYLDDVLYVFCEVWFDTAGHYMESRLHPVVYKYNHISDHAVVQITALGANANRVRHLITPIYTVSKAEDRAILQQVSAPAFVSMQARHACLGASMIKNADTDAAQPVPGPVIVVASRGKPAPFNFKIIWDPKPGSPLEGALSVQLPPREAFEVCYRDAISTAMSES
jgi:hypothetical protein